MSETSSLNFDNDDSEDLIEILSDSSENELIIGTDSESKTDDGPTSIPRINDVVESNMVIKNTTKNNEEKKSPNIQEKSSNSSIHKKESQKSEQKQAELKLNLSQNIEDPSTEPHKLNKAQKIQETVKEQADTEEILKPKQGFEEQAETKEVLKQKQENKIPTGSNENQKQEIEKQVKKTDIRNHKEENEGKRIQEPNEKTKGQHKSKQVKKLDEQAEKKKVENSNVEVKEQSKSKEAEIPIEAVKEQIKSKTDKIPIEKPVEQIKSKNDKIPAGEVNVQLKSKRDKIHTGAVEEQFKSKQDKIPTEGNSGKKRKSKIAHDSSEEFKEQQQIKNITRDKGRHKTKDRKGDAVKAVDRRKIEDQEQYKLKNPQKSKENKNAMKSKESLDIKGDAQDQLKNKLEKKHSRDSSKMEKQKKHDDLYTISLLPIPNLTAVGTELDDLPQDAILGIATILYAILREDLEKYVKIKCNRKTIDIRNLLRREPSIIAKGDLVEDIIDSYLAENKQIKWSNYLKYKLNKKGLKNIVLKSYTLCFNFPQFGKFDETNYLITFDCRSFYNGMKLVLKWFEIDFADCCTALFYNDNHIDVKSDYKSHDNE